MDSGAAGGSSASVHSSPSSFSMAMQSIVTLLREKLVCGSKDVVAIVLYNTRVSIPSTGFSGVYVVQEATRVGIECIQKMEYLEAAGTPGSSAYEEFKSRVGHWPTAATSSAPTTASLADGSVKARAALSADSVSPPAFKFSEVLWEAQRIFLSICSLQAIRHRRLFVFTNCDNPSGGDAREWNLCRSRACALSKEGAVLEVFGFGKTGSGGVPHTSSGSTVAGKPGDAGWGGHSISSMSAVVTGSTGADKSGSPAPPLFPIFDTRDQSLDPMPVGTAAAGSNQNSSCLSNSPPTAVIGFMQDYFWGPLVMEMQMASTRCIVSGDTNDLAALREARAETFVSGGEGAVHVNAGAAMLQRLLVSVVRRGNPQRPFQYCQLRIGSLCGATTPLPAMTAAEKTTEEASRVAAVPRMAVSVYLPFMRARPPQKQWLDGRTNRVLRRVVHLHAGTNVADEEGDSGGAEDQEEVSDSCTNPLRCRRSEVDCTEESLRRQKDVVADVLCYYAPVGKERVYLTSEERKRIVEVAAAGAEPGFTVLLFKDLVDAVPREHSVRRSAFLHSCVQRGGVHSHRLFVLFVRQLRAKKKVAIAQYCSSVTKAPRLVALVPSPDLTANPEKRSQVPIDGLGLYVVPLPYAEELRSVPKLNTCKVDNKHASPVLEDTSVDPTHLELAKQMVNALTVSYRLDAVSNPALQRQYRKLQELARRRFPSANSLLYPDAGTSLRTTGGEDTPARGADEAMLELDNTLPDYEGMKSYAALFQDFNKEVLGSDYNASLYCPKSRTADSATRRSRDGAAGSRAAEGGILASAGGDGAHIPIEELIRQASAENAWDCLTIPQLKEYLAAAHVSTGGARRKADLVERVKQHLPPPT
ncbi:hypothetical protein JKF63_00565 [Porcisia hertigi]|uniref:Ku domain-containing protein n=1 Tax=Porcisia hertigi TaxID=2761500 RepID=A0A836L162_9TRYP|nr:hypothetical protein JKF63_00565 [Porcisia hertigi]